MIDMHVMHQDDLKNCENPFSDNINYKKIIRFADDTLRSKINNWNLNIIYYTQAKEALSQARTKEDYKKVASKFSSIANYRDSSVLAEKCYKKATQKKPLFKKWWFWVIVGVVLALLSSRFEDNTDSRNDSITDTISNETVLNYKENTSSKNETISIEEKLILSE